MANRYTKEEVIDIIERFLDGADGRWEWGDFTSLRIEDPALDAVRRRCQDAWDENAERWRTDELRAMLAELRRS